VLRQKSKDIKIAKLELMKQGARSEVIAAIVAWLMGFSIAPLFLSITRSDNFTGNWWGGTHSRGWAPPITDEMVGRGDFHNFLVGIVFALASGIVVGNGASSGGTNALVGVAISASLLPPVVNSGMCVSYALLGPLWADEDSWQWNEDHQQASDGLFATSDFEGLGGLPMREQLLAAGAISFALYLMNVVIILCVCWMVFVIKDVEFVLPTIELARDDATSSRDNEYEALPDVIAGQTRAQGVGMLKREGTVADLGLLYGEDDDDFATVPETSESTPKHGTEHQDVASVPTEERLPPPALTDQCVIS
jgi:hypothetical protein